MENPFDIINQKLDKGDSLESSPAVVFVKENRFQWAKLSAETGLSQGIFRKKIQNLGLLAILGQMQKALKDKIVAFDLTPIFDSAFSNLKPIPFKSVKPQYQLMLGYPQTMMPVFMEDLFPNKKFDKAIFLKQNFFPN